MNTKMRTYSWQLVFYFSYYDYQKEYNENAEQTEKYMAVINYWSICGMIILD
jgi:hypothetical protein